MLYHTQIYMPLDVANLVPYGRVLPLEYSCHAATQSFVKYRIDYRKLPNPLVVQRPHIIEIETDEYGNLVKFVARLPFNGRDDICYAIMRKRGGWLVKTVWLNSVSDKHKTLRKNLYVTA